MCACVRARLLSVRVLQSAASVVSVHVLLCIHGSTVGGGLICHEITVPQENFHFVADPSGVCTCTEHEFDDKITFSSATDLEVEANLPIRRELSLHRQELVLCSFSKRFDEKA